jgi:hypothetical protein
MLKQRKTGVRTCHVMALGLAVGTPCFGACFGGLLAACGEFACSSRLQSRRLGMLKQWKAGVRACHVMALLDL